MKFLKLKNLHKTVVLVVILLIFLKPQQGTAMELKPNAAISDSNPGFQGLKNIISKVDNQAAFVQTKMEGAGVYCGELLSTANFTWQFVYNGKYGNDYYIVNQNSMLLLAVENASVLPSAKLVTERLAKNTESDWNIRDELLFFIEPVGQFFKIRSILSGLYLTKTDSEANAIVQQVDPGSDTDNQLWSLPQVATPEIEFNHLVWAEEFNYQGFPNDSIWSFEQINVNNEVQQYTVNDRENCYVENGSLRITANYPPYTSARIISKGKYDFQYGRVEARIKVAGGRGTWPAFWMMPTSHSEYNPWPNCGEIDIMEYVGFDPYKIHGHVHNKIYNGMIGTDHGASVSVSDPVENWHVYGIGWSEDRIIFYVDDWVYYIYENIQQGYDTYPYTYPFYIIFNLAIGGNWGGAMGIDLDIFPTSYYVDWVRVYQEGFDNRAPLEVVGLKAQNVTSNQISLIWNSSNAADLHHYIIYRNGTEIGTTLETSYIDSGVNENSTYLYEISAMDVYGNEGFKSQPIEIYVSYQEPEPTSENKNKISSYPYLSLIGIATVILLWKKQKWKFP